MPVRKHAEPGPDDSLEESPAKRGVAAWHRHVQNCDARSQLGRAPWHRGIGSTSGASVGYRAVRRCRELAQKVLNETPARRSGPRDVPSYVDVHDGNPARPRLMAGLVAFPAKVRTRWCRLSPGFRSSGDRPSSATTHGVLDCAH